MAHNLINNHTIEVPSVSTGLAWSDSFDGLQMMNDRDSYKKLKKNGSDLGGRHRRDRDNRDRSRSGNRIDNERPDFTEPFMQNTHEPQVQIGQNINTMNPEIMNNMFQQQGMMAAGIMPFPSMFPNGVMGGNMEYMNNAIDPTMYYHGMANQFNSFIPPASNMDMESVVNEPIPPLPREDPPRKDIIALKSCTLLPPFPGTIAPVTRERPPGCRTIFVGGLPDVIKEDTVREIFGRFGKITSIRISSKSYCHIRYEQESSVDKALTLSGYRLRVDDKTDSADPNTGWLHVDYAQARDDRHDYECRQRAAERQQRHKARRSPTPPAIPHYTDHAALVVSENIKQEPTFEEAIKVLLTWLERGDCSKRNVNTFYSMIQSTNSHVRRLFTEKTQYEEELQGFKSRIMEKIMKIISQFEQVEKVMNAAAHKRVWDHFTKPQRKNIAMWQKLTEEMATMREEYKSEKTGIHEMDVSDSDDDEKEKPVKVDSEDLKKLKEENNKLQCQLEAYKNEAEVIRQDAIKELEMWKAQYTAGQLMKEAAASKSESELKIESSASSTADVEISEAGPSNMLLEDPATKHKTAKLLCLISAFLHVHPFGASSDYLASYVQQFESNMRSSQLEALLRSFPDIFLRRETGVGANLERKWIFTGFFSQIGN